jgi:hypothetical protein
MSAFEMQKLSASIAIDKGPKTNHQQVKAAFGTERMRITPTARQERLGLLSRVSELMLR